MTMTGGNRGTLSKTEELLAKAVAAPFGPPQISHGLAWDQTRASRAGGQPLTV
jgi:hypothetical protein